jgi:hypothetical protein
MKNTSFARKFWLLLLAPLFIQGVCNKDNNDLEQPNADEFVTWKISGANGSLTVAPDSLSMYRWGTSTAIYGTTQWNSTSPAYFALSFDGPEQSGTYQATEFMVVAGGKYYVPASAPLQVNVTNYGSTGQYMVGTYNGAVKDSATSATLSVSGSFKIKND